MAVGTVANPSASNNAPIYSPLSDPLWPQFPDSVPLNGRELSHLYRTACGVMGIARLLNRSMQLRGEAEDFEDIAEHPLSPVDESNLWCALTALSAELVYLVENWHQRTQEEPI